MLLTAYKNEVISLSSVIALALLEISCSSLTVKFVTCWEGNMLVCVLFQCWWGLWSALVGIEPLQGWHVLHGLTFGLEPSPELASVLLCATVRNSLFSEDRCFHGSSSTFQLWSWMAAMKEQKLWRLVRCAFAKIVVVVTLCCLKSNMTQKLKFMTDVTCNSPFKYWLRS